MSKESVLCIMRTSYKVNHSVYTEPKHVYKYVTI